MRLEVVGAVVAAVMAEQFFIQNSAKADTGNTADKRAADGTEHGTRCRSCWTGNAEHRSANAPLVEPAAPLSAPATVPTAPPIRLP